VAKNDKAIRDMLHDAIDFQETQKNKAAEIVYRIVKDKLAEALNETPDIESALLYLAEKIDEELTELTTETFQGMAEMAEERYSE
jgi:hypothetical protein